uniref:Uncharacterized protein n=1 Tax=uncultured marine virus TaxID=186617 RepID=A0A0F7L5L9_9VIRU|nr:hypothetical protein [uncultured marine virus]
MSSSSGCLNAHRIPAKARPASTKADRITQASHARPSLLSIDAPDPIGHRKPRRSDYTRQHYAHRVQNIGYSISHA